MHRLFFYYFFLPNVSPNERTSRVHTADPFQLLPRVLACFPFYRSPYLAISVVQKMQPCMPEAERHFQRVGNYHFEQKGVPGIPTGANNNTFSIDIVKSPTPL